MSNESQIFGFEMDFAGSLRCIPMIVRFKLDQCGVKLSLRQWGKFARDERNQLVVNPCASAAEIESYKDYLIRLIVMRAQGAAVILPIDNYPEWAAIDQVPARVASAAVAHDLIPPRSERWAALTPLQRFALFKLTRPGHDNDNFVPAMLEFGFSN